MLTKDNNSRALKGGDVLVVDKINKTLSFFEKGDRGQMELRWHNGNTIRSVSVKNWPEMYSIISIIAETNNLLVDEDDVVNSVESIFFHLREKP